MADAQNHLDSAIAEIDRAQKYLAKIKAVQIRNDEQRDFIKATAFSWFRNHRTFLTELLPPELVADIDSPYRALLSAAERSSSRSTHVNSVRQAKKALLAARDELLVATKPIQTGNAIPNFAPLASSIDMQSILTRRWEECAKCIAAGAPLAATVMMGGLLEALFLSRANKLADKADLFRAKSAPMDPKTKKPLELRQWMLAPYIDVGHELKWISRSAKDVSVILRDYRNYVHPEKERSHGVVLTLDDATMFWEITKNLCKELLAMKGIS